MFTLTFFFVKTINKRGVLNLAVNHPEKVKAYLLI